jgi:hypothetical protein
VALGAALAEPLAALASPGHLALLSLARGRRKELGIFAGREGAELDFFFF